MVGNGTDGQSGETGTREETREGKEEEEDGVTTNHGAGRTTVPVHVLWQPQTQQSLAGADENGGGGGGGPPPIQVIEPNFAPSGALAAETLTFQGVVLKYHEPPEARKPVRSWRLYVFKGKEQVDLIHVHRQSAYLLGRDRIVADIPIDHPSTSKQHAVLQFRQVIERNEFGDSKTMTKPFIIDLDSANGTAVNDEMIPPSRYYELKTGDVLKFAFSTREYVLLAET